MAHAVDWMERRQIPLYLAAIAVAVIVGLAAPTVANPLTVAMIQG